MFPHKGIGFGSGVDPITQALDLTKADVSRQQDGLPTILHHNIESSKKELMVVTSLDTTSEVAALEQNLEKQLELKLQRLAAAGGLTFTYGIENKSAAELLNENFDKETLEYVHDTMIVPTIIILQPDESFHDKIKKIDEQIGTPSGPKAKTLVDNEDTGQSLTSERAEEMWGDRYEHLQICIVEGASDPNNVQSKEQGLRIPRIGDRVDEEPHAQAAEMYQEDQKLFSQKNNTQLEVGLISAKEFATLALDSIAEENELLTYETITLLNNDISGGSVWGNWQRPSVWWNKEEGRLEFYADRWERRLRLGITNFDCDDVLSKYDLNVRFRASVKGKRYPRIYAWGTNEGSDITLA